MEGYASNSPPASTLPAGRIAFPRKVKDFNQDPRVAYATDSESWVLDEGNGDKWEFNLNAEKWVPLVDAALVEQQQQAYISKDYDQPMKSIEQPIPRGSSATSDEQAGLTRTGPKKGKADEKPAEAPNTAIYVTSIPLDATIDEVNEIFRKFGIIQEEIYSNRPRIKMYTDEDGNFKGEALIVYLKPASVLLAIQMMDETDFDYSRPGPNGLMRVVEADKSYKKTSVNKSTEKTTAPGSKKPHNSSRKDVERIIQKTKMMENKLADWDDDDVSAIVEPARNPKFDTLVILKNLASPEEVKNWDSKDHEDLELDIKEECEKFGPIVFTNFYPEEPDCVVTVRFTQHEHAIACVKKMHGRFFDNRQLVAYIADGTEWFKGPKRKRNSPAHGRNDDEDESEETKRIKSFGDYLEGKGAKHNGADNAGQTKK